MDGVVSLSVERIADDVEAFHFLVGDDDPLLMDVAIKFAADREPCRSLILSFWIGIILRKNAGL